MRIIQSIFIILLLACLTNCSNNEIHDPVWNVGLNWPESDIMTRLTPEYGVKQYPFSFKREFHIDYSGGTAFINSHLNRPTFENGRLNQFSYTVSPETNNKASSGFDTEMYESVKPLWINAFGTPDEELQLPMKIVLKWQLADGMTLTITASKQFNNYTVEYIRTLLSD